MVGKPKKPDPKVNQETQKNTKITHNQRVMENAATTIGLSPINLEDILFHIKSPTEEDKKVGDKFNINESTKKAMFDAAEEYLIMELKFTKKEVKNLDIKQVFVTRSFPKNKTLYIQLPSRKKASIVHHHSLFINHLSGHGKPCLTKFIPPSLFPRYKAVERLAHSIRQDISNPQSTNIRMGDDDLIFRTRPKGDKTPWRYVKETKLPNTHPPILNSTKQTKQTPTKAPGRPHVVLLLTPPKNKTSKHDISTDSSTKNETGKLDISNVDSAETNDNEIQILNDTTYTNRLKTNQEDILNKVKTRSQTSSTPKTQNIQLSP